MEHAPTQEVGPTEAQSMRGWPLLIVVAVAVGGIALSFGLMRDLASIIAPVFFAINLLVAAYPIYRWLIAHRAPRLVASLATGLAVFLVLIAFVAALVWSVTQMISTLTGYTDEFTSLFNRSLDLLARLGIDNGNLMESLRSISPASVLNLVGGLLSNASSAGALILVIIVSMVFMLMDLPSMGKRIGMTNRLHPEFTESISSLVLGIRRYWVVTTIFGLIVAVLDGVVLVALGVSLPVVWAVLSFITNYIPNVGFVIGLVPPALLALFEKGPVTALIVVAAYSILNFVIQTIIQPKFTGDAVGVTPTVSFISLLLWAWVLGPLGALLALPMTLAVKALLIDSDPRMRWMNAFISNDPKDRAAASTT